ncbi:MAG: Uma2 family endonuclease [Actinobacteria bacterium]|nr:Uma2 family endonuclease [Actinomycetota bacterium]
MSAPPEMTDVVRPLYRVEYDALVEQGFLVDEPVELLEGRLLAASPEGDRHATVIRRLTRLLVEAIPADEGDIGVGNPIALSDLSEPEPDLAVFPPASGYRAGHPSTATLLIEVSRSSLRRDRTLKRRIYAQAGVPDYWIVDLQNDVLSVHRDPADVDFRSVTHLQRGDVRPLHHPRLRIAVGELLR